MCDTKFRESTNAELSYTIYDNIINFSFYADSQTLRKRLRFTDTNSFLSDDWYTRLTMSQCEEIEQGRKEEMKWKRQKLQAFQSKMIAIFRR